MENWTIYKITFLSFIFKSALLSSLRHAIHPETVQEFIIAQFCFKMWKQACIYFIHLKGKPFFQQFCARPQTNLHTRHCNERSHVIHAHAQRKLFRQVKCFSQKWRKTNFTYRWVFYQVDLCKLHKREKIAEHSSNINVSKSQSYFLKHQYMSLIKSSMVVCLLPKIYL